MKPVWAKLRPMIPIGTLLNRRYLESTDVVDKVDMIDVQTTFLIQSIVVYYICLIGLLTALLRWVPRSRANDSAFAVGDEIFRFLQSLSSSA